MHNSIQSQPPPLPSYFVLLKIGATMWYWRELILGYKFRRITLGSGSIWPLLWSTWPLILCSKKYTHRNLTLYQEVFTATLIYESGPADVMDFPCCERFMPRRHRLRRERSCRKKVPQQQTFVGGILHFTSDFLSLENNLQTMSPDLRSVRDIWKHCMANFASSLYPIVRFQ